MNNGRISAANPNEQQAIVAANSYIEAWRDPEWQRLWLAVEGRPWRSLALIPGGDGASPDLTLVIAVTLSRTGMVHLGRPIQVADATKVPLDQLASFLNEVKRIATDSERLLVALPPTANSPITSTIAQTVDAALLCVQLDRMSSAQTKRTVKLVGQSRFVGSAIFHSNDIARAR